MRLSVIGICLIALLCLSTGCTTVQQGAVVGGGLGAGTGAIWAHNVGKLDSMEGALVGLAAGGLAGALVGDLLDECKDKAREEELQQHICDLEGKLADKDKTISDLKDEIAKLKKELASRPEVQVDGDGGRIRFTVLNEVLFDSGKAKIKAEGLETIDAVMKVIQKNYPDRQINVEGHTDSDPIKISGWKTNWELSAARALALVHHMIDEKAMDADSLSAQAFSMYKPVASNDTDEGKRQNRRAVIVVMPKEDLIVKECEK